MKLADEHLSIPFLFLLSLLIFGLVDLDAKSAHVRQLVYHEQACCREPLVQRPLMEPIERDLKHFCARGYSTSPSDRVDAKCSATVNDIAILL